MLRKASERSPLDFYPTPQTLCNEVCGWLARTFGPRTSILEPSSGSGNFLRSLSAYFGSDATRIWGCDLNPESRTQAFKAGATGFLEGDFLSIDTEQTEFDLIAGNPPYNAAEEHIRRALTLLAPGGILALVLRINFLGATKRLPFWREHPPLCMAPIVPRPDFSGGGGDSTEYALYVWQRDHTGPSILKPHLTWQKQAKARAA